MFNAEFFQDMILFFLFDCAPRVSVEVVGAALTCFKNTFFYKYRDTFGFTFGFTYLSSICRL